MQKTKIDWPWKPLYTWNPFTGCSHGCEYCYARGIMRRFGKSFDPTIHPARMEEPELVTKPRNIFVCDMGDIFDKNFSDSDISHLFDRMVPPHTYFVLTKQPQRYERFLPVNLNIWCGITLTGKEPRRLAEKQVDLMGRVGNICEQYTFLSAEPLLGDLSWIPEGAFDQIIVGPDSRKGQPKPDPKWLPQGEPYLKESWRKMFKENP